MSAAPVEPDEVLSRLDAGLAELENTIRQLRSEVITLRKDRVFNRRQESQEGHGELRRREDERG